MKKINLLISMICAGVVFLAVSNASANSCFLATESGSSDNCDSGEAQSSLPVHELTTTSKAGTMGLCNNVNAFADEKQAIEYAKTHEYDLVAITKKGCHVPYCVYDSEFKCRLKKSACCLSLVNNECWHECAICTFNKIGREFYPYASSSMERCELVGSGGMDYVSALYTSTNTNKNYKINGLRNLTPLSDINDSIWFCDYEAVNDILNYCSQEASNTSYIVGHDEDSVLNVSYLCINGSKLSLSQDAVSFVNEYGCPLSAVQCDESKGYYNDEDICQRKSLNNNPCSVVVTYKGYGDSECWHTAKRCSDFGHGDYITGNYNSLTCPAGSNTELQYYLNKVTGKVVELNDKKCGACECISGTTRLSSCNSLFYEVVSNYFNSKKVTGKTSSCDLLGYSRTNPSGGNCTACPYNATYWKCN